MSAATRRAGRLPLGPPVKAARRTKYPLGKPLVVAMTEGRIDANARATAERRFAEDWHAVSGLIYIHPCDFHIGMDVHWHRKGRVLHGTVVTVNEDMLRPVKVLGKRIQDRQYHYTPSVYDFCDKDGRKPCVCELPIGRRTECQHKPHCPIPGIDKALYGTPDVYKGPPGVKLMQGHSPAALSGTFHSSNPVPDMVIAGSMMGPDEYATLGGPDNFPDGGRPNPWQFQIAEYELRESRKGNGQWGIYCRDYNVRLATFAPNSFALRDALARGFDAAHAKKQSEIARFKVSKMPVDAQIKHRQKQERAANKGWYTCQCGQWVNDKECPCSVCRKPRKKK